MFHALELGLKAFLIRYGMTEEDLSKRPYGHDLERLYSEALRHGLSLRFADANKMIAWCNEWHSGRIKIRYKFTETRTLPMCRVVFPLIEEIIERGLES